MTQDEMDTFIWRNRVWQAATVIYEAWSIRQVRQGLKTDLSIDGLPAQLADLLTDMLKGRCDPPPEDSTQAIESHPQDFRWQPPGNGEST